MTLTGSLFILGIGIFVVVGCVFITYRIIENETE